jgi:uncharacterized protein YbjT (DUF2867 family)
MRLVVFGATGPTGRELVAQALEQGHEVTVFARRPQAVTAQQGKLRVAKGDTMREPDAIEEALRGQDAALCALGAGKVFFPNRLMERSIGNIVPAMQRAGVKRFILMSAFGVGETASRAPILPRFLYATLLSGLFADKERAEETLRASALDWTIVYPVMLTDGPRTGTYRSGEALELTGLPTISRADVAHCMLAELASGAHIRKGMAISY